jgi:hypothetical protein
VIRASVCSHNPGILGLLEHSGQANHSGHGILVTSVDTGIIEQCQAYENGACNTAQACGPAGIWASQSRRLIIRNNESYRNRSASATDGGGFGLDGAVVDSVLEGNHSHDNDGPGFQFAQYFGAKPFRNNRIIGNLSVNDARRNDYGAIQIWAADGHCIEDCLIQGNTVRLEESREGRPRAFFLEGRTDKLVVRENRFYCQGISMPYEIGALQRDLIFEDNLLE